MNRRIWIIARVGFGLSIFGVLLVGLDIAAVAALFRSANLPLAMVGISGLVAVHLLGAVTWRRLVYQLSSVRLPWQETVGIYYSAQAIGAVTPANLGGDAYRVYAVSGDKASEVRLWPVLIQRVTSYAALIAIALVALIPLWRSAESGVQLAMVGVLGLAIAGAVALGLFRASRRFGLDTVASVPRVRVIVALTDGFLLGLIFHAAAIGLTYLLVQAVAPEQLSLPALSAVAVARLAVAIPITPSGLGVQEGLLALLFVSIGIASEIALGAMLLARCSLVVTALVALAFARHRRVLVNATTNSAPRAQGVAIPR